MYPHRKASQSLLHSGKVILMQGFLKKTEMFGRSFISSFAIQMISAHSIIQNL